MSHSDIIERYLALIADDCFHPHDGAGAGDKR
jgi:hypothetical protein